MTMLIRSFSFIFLGDMALGYGGASGFGNV